MSKGYVYVGDHHHSALKPCYWFEEKLNTGVRNCYKSFFGVESNLCIQATPSVSYCTHSCVFCWRDIEKLDKGYIFPSIFDDPKLIANDLIKAQVKLIRQKYNLEKPLNMVDNLKQMLRIFQETGDHKLSFHLITRMTKLSNNKVNSALKYLINGNLVKKRGDSLFFNTKFIRSLKSGIGLDNYVETNIASKIKIIQAHKDALTPKHAALSLAGEPILYPAIDLLVHEFRKKNMTTFIVSNGTLPKKISLMDHYPSQLYITLPASNEKDYKIICRPKIKDGWMKLNTTLKNLNTLSCRTCVRITGVKNLNLKNPSEYVKLVEESNPNFLEVKGFTLEASSLHIGRRLSIIKKDDIISNKDLNKIARSYVPSHQEIKNFASKLGYPIVRESESSRYVLMLVNWNLNKDLKIAQP